MNDECLLDIIESRADSKPISRHCAISLAVSPKVKYFPYILIRNEIMKTQREKRKSKCAVL